jgi:hypothetical protein
LANFGATGYLHPELIYKASTATLTTGQAQARALDESLGLYVDVHGVYENFLGMGEKWLRGANNAFGNPWYVVKPNGDFLAWNGTAAGGTLLGNFGAAGFLNPALIYQAFTFPLNPGTLSPTTAVGLDFNPVTDQLRLVTDNGQNFRVSLPVGHGFLDTPLAYAPPLAAVVPHIAAVSYSNNFASTASTTLYAIDTNRNSLEVISPENNGTLTEIGSLGLVTAEGIAGFDIVGSSNVALAVLRVNGQSRLYTINLTTGAATLVNGTGAVGALDMIFGLAVVA